METVWWVCDGERQLYSSMSERTARRAYAERLDQGYDALTLLRNDDGVDTVVQVEEGKEMKTYDYRTDGESGTVQARSLDEALAIIAPTPGQINDGGYAVVTDPDTTEQLWVGNPWA